MEKWLEVKKNSTGNQLSRYDYQFFACTNIYLKQGEVELKRMMFGQDILLSFYYNCYKNRRGKYWQWHYR